MYCWPCSLCGRGPSLSIAMLVKGSIMMENGIWGASNLFWVKTFWCLHVSQYHHHHRQHNHRLYNLCHNSPNHPIGSFTYVYQSWFAWSHFEFLIPYNFRHLCHRYPAWKCWATSLNGHISSRVCHRTWWAILYPASLRICGRTNHFPLNYLQLTLPVRWVDSLKKLRITVLY